MSESDDIGNTEPPRQSADRLYGALGNAERRLVVAYLEATDESVTLEELADAMAARTDGCQRESASDLDSIKLRLHHCHLPKLGDAGLLSYDCADRTVRSLEHPVYSMVGQLPGFDVFG